MINQFPEEISIPFKEGLALVVVTGFHDIVRRTGPRNVIVTACGPVVGDFLAATLNNCSSFCVSLHLRSASLREFYFILVSFFLFFSFSLGRELSRIATNHVSDIKVSIIVKFR